MESRHEPMQCARCNGTFQCKPFDITNCQCNTVSLTEAELHYLQSKYDDCLCADCLRAIKQEYSLLIKYDFIKRTPLA